MMEAPARWLSFLNVKLEEPELDEQQIRQFNSTLWCSELSRQSLGKEEEPCPTADNNYYIHQPQQRQTNLRPEASLSLKFSRVAIEKKRKSETNDCVADQKLLSATELSAKAACIYCDKFLKSSPSLQKHVHRQHKDVALKCKQRSCTRYFKNERERKHHSRLEHAFLKMRRKVDCIYCGKTYPDKKSHYHHVKRKHIEEAIKCKFTRCGKLFLTETELNSHFDVIHADKEKLKSLLCADCPYRSESKVLLKKHIVQHHFPRLFSCKSCPQTFGSGANLKYHVTSVHLSKKDCPHCGSLLSNTYFNLHLVTAICRVCTDLFPCVKLLKVHESKCKRFKLLGCVYCRSVCNSKMELREHTIKCQLETELSSKIKVRSLSEMESVPY